MKRIGDNAQLSSNKYFPHTDVASKFHFFTQNIKKNWLIPGFQLAHEMNLQHLVTPANTKRLIIPKDSRLAKHGTLKHQSL